MSWTLRGADTAKIRQAVEQAAAEGLRAAAEHVFAESQRIVPNVEGKLAASGRALLVTSTRAEISYSYKGAVDAHERLDVRPANGRRRKYLESAMNSERTEAAEIIAAAVRKRIGS